MEWLSDNMGSGKRQSHNTFIFHKLEVTKYPISPTVHKHRHIHTHAHIFH